MSLNQEKIDLFIRLLKDYNQHTNIYSTTAYDRLPFHIQDSLNMAQMIPDTTLSVADLGSGAGFPSVFIALFNDRNRVVAIESKAKKRRFLQQVKTELGLSNFEIFEGDADLFSVQKPIVPTFITAKAFAKVPMTIAIAQKIGSKKPTTLIIPVSLAQCEAFSQLPDLETVKQQIAGQDYYYLKRSL